MENPRQATLLLPLREQTLFLGEKITGEIGKGLLNGPGGGVEPDESILECIIRETYEETGIVVRADKLVFVAKLDCLVNGDIRQQVFVYATESFTGEPRATQSMVPAGWFPVHDLPFDRMHEGDRHFMPRAIDAYTKPFLRFHARIHYKEPGKGFIKIESLPL